MPFYDLLFDKKMAYPCSFLLHVETDQLNKNKQ
jgi:hypothetical protein